MDWYYYIASAAIISQLVFLVQMYRNFRYVSSKHKRPRQWYRPRTVLIVPCKGYDLDFEKNIASFYNQDYENYLLWFVVAAQSDPAFNRLCKLKEEFGPNSKAENIQIMVAGHSQTCGQKNYNLLYAYNKISDRDNIEILAFADSDVCIRSDWLSHIVYPLRKSQNGVASGYRWFVPKKNNPATLALSALNAKIAQLLGNSRFNQAWGGSMAVRFDTFKQIGLDKIWSKALSDDLSLSYAAKKAGLKVAFVPACLVASYQATSWAELFEFGRRQFLITRISAPGTWLFGLFGNLYSVLGLWGGTALAIYAAEINHKNLALFTAVPIIFFVSQLSRAVLRQIMISRLLKKDLPKMRFSMAVDILFFWLWSLLMLAIIISSAFGRTIKWRNIRYKLLGPAETAVVSREGQPPSA